MLRYGRQFFSMRQGLLSHCLRLRIVPVEFVLEAGRRSRTRCQKGAISRPAKSSMTVLQAVSQKKHVMKARVRMKSALVANLVLSTVFDKELSWEQMKTPPLTTEGKNATLVSRNSPRNEPTLSNNPLSKNERRTLGDILHFILCSVTTSPSLQSPLPHQD
jgi:hypothetical protein